MTRLWRLAACVHSAAQASLPLGRKRHESETETKLYHEAFEIPQEGGSEAFQRNAALVECSSLFPEIDVQSLDGCKVTYGEWMKVRL